MNLTKYNHTLEKAIEKHISYSFFQPYQAKIYEITIDTNNDDKNIVAHIRIKRKKEIKVINIETTPNGFRIDRTPSRKILTLALEDLRRRVSQY